MNPILVKLYHRIFPRHSGNFCKLIALIFIASILEFFSIGLVIPFLSILLDPQKLINISTQYHLYFLSNTDLGLRPLLIITFLFIFFTVLSAITRLFLIRFQTRLAFHIGSELSLDVYKNILNQPYAFHINQNTSEITSSLSHKADSVVHGIILPAISIMSALIILLAILLILYFTDSLLGFLTLIFFTSTYYLISKFTKMKLSANGVDIAKEYTNVIRILNEGLGGIRDIILDGSQNVHYTFFHKADLKLRHAQSSVLTIASSPRYIIEAVAMICIALTAYLLSNSNEGLLSYLPTLGVLVLASQRMLPMLQQIYGGWSQIHSSSESLKDVLKFLDSHTIPAPHKLPQEKYNKISLTSSIRLHNLNFSYPSRDSQVLNGFSLQIHKGERIGLIGASGSGKSTLIDIIMTLLTPTSGLMYVDEKKIDEENAHLWRNNIAHVPQSIFLADATVLENIAFGVDPLDIDLNRVKRAAEQAKISTTIDSWPDGYQTYVGEKGVGLSGGQKQRIGIARALYKQANIIIFDEATSALDYATEKEIMDCINMLSEDVTLIITAHRLRSLSGCTKIIELSNGKLMRTGTYKEIIDSEILN